MAGSNNVAEMGVNHDRPPMVKSPQVIGSNVVERGSLSPFSPRAMPTITLTPSTPCRLKLRSPTGQNNWDASVVSGGENVLTYRNSAQEGREYFITPTGAMAAGDFDIAHERSTAVSNK